MKLLSPSVSAAMLGCSLIGGAAICQKALATDFVVRIENVSARHTLKTSQGDKCVGISPGVWCLHSGNNPIFTVGRRATTGLKHLAEDGNPEGLFSDLQFNSGVKATGAFDYAAAPYPVAGFIGPMQAFEFVVPNASKGDRLSFATMFIESNDWFYSNNSKGIELFGADGAPMNGDVTRFFGLWDAGTEETEEPGVGMNQAPRQARPGTGRSASRPVYAVMPPSVGFNMVMNRGAAESGMGRWNAPAVQGVVKITITPR